MTGLRVAIVALTLFATGTAEGGVLDVTEGELATEGFVALDLRYFSQGPRLPEVVGRGLQPSLVLQPELFWEWNDGDDRIAVVPFLRLEYDDAERRHGDFRELHWLHVADRWDLLVGMGKVFWGVTESRHLVDVVNQVDFVEDPDEEERLGQPMVRLASFHDWGTVTLFALGPFRERTFPGRRGRLRAPLVVDVDHPSYESSLEEWAPSGAIRWSHFVGEFDFALSHFSGTSREPRFFLAPPEEPEFRPSLVPHYDRIHQTSLEGQWTHGSWLWKLEAISREGHGGRFFATVAGFEYTFFGIFGSAADLGVLGEYLYDGRDEDPSVAPPTPFDDDLFGGSRLALNDVQSTEVLAGAVVDRDTQATFALLEASRRVGERWVVELTARVFANVPPGDFLGSAARDDYVELRIARYF